MKNFELGQIWEGCLTQQPLNWSETVSFKINKIDYEFNEITGIIVSNNLLFSLFTVGNVFKVNIYAFNNFNSFNWRLKQNLIGIRCDRCRKFYNEAINNKTNNKISGHYKVYFKCWRCDLNV